MFIVRRIFCSSLVRRPPEQELLRKRLRLPKDRYGIARLINIHFLYDLIRSPPVGGFTINQLIVLAYRIAQLSFYQKHPLRVFDFQALLVIIDDRLRNPQDYPSIGKIALGLAKVGKADKAFVAKLADCLISRKYDDDFDEIYAAAAAFDSFYFAKSQDWLIELCRKVYQQLQDSIIIFIKQLKYNTLTVIRIADIFYRRGARQENFWLAVQFFFEKLAIDLQSKSQQSLFICHNELLEKRLFQHQRESFSLSQAFVQINYYLTRHKLFSKRLLEATERLVSLALKYQFYKNKLPELPAAETLVLNRPHQIQDKNIHKLLYILHYGVKQGIHQPSSSVLTLLQQRVQQSSMSIQAIIIFFKAKQILRTDIRSLLFDKFFNIDTDQHNYTLSQLNQFMVVQSIQYEGSENIPFKFINQYQQLAIRKLHSVEGKQIHDLVRFIERYSLIKKLRDLCQSLPSAVNRLTNYFTFEENCYFFYILKSNQRYWTQLSPKYEGQMQLLKDQIKTTVNSRGFKMDMNSYFYKLLTQIDNVSFFDGG